YTEVRPVLEEAVSRYSSSAGCARGRFELADTYRQLALEENEHVVQGGNLPPETREHFLQQRRKWLTLAAEQLELLGQVLAKDARTAAPLTRTEQVQVLFSLADCRFNLGEYSAALKLYGELAERYRGRLERLNAL